MRVYRVSWFFFCGVLGAFGAFGAFGAVVAVTWSLSTVIMLLICGCVAGGVVAMIVLDPKDQTRLPRDSRRIVAKSSILAGAATVAFGGVAVMVGGSTAVLLLAVTAGGSPYAIDYCVGRLRDRGHLSKPVSRPARPDPTERWSGSVAAPISWTEPSRPSEPHVPPAALRDDALCLAWRISFSALQSARSPAERLSVVDERRAYLDELENRNARGMAAWLASGARAAGDPSRFVQGDSVSCHDTIDWDSLIHGTDS